MAKDKKSKVSRSIGMDFVFSPPPAPKLDHEKVEAIKTLTSDKSLERYIPSDLRNLVAAFEDGMKCKHDKEYDKKETKTTKGKK
jgi:hypothetical protein